ncbi:hypothetical protein Tco_0490854 [Tanacetum coccineum]
MRRVVSSVGARVRVRTSGGGYGGVECWWVRLQVNTNGLTNLLKSWLSHTSVLDGEEVFAGQDVVDKEVSTADPVTTAGEVVTTASVKVSAATTTTTTAITKVDLTLAQALAELRSAKPKVEYNHNSTFNNTQS